MRAVLVVLFAAALATVWWRTVTAFGATAAPPAAVGGVGGGTPPAPRTTPSAPAVASAPPLAAGVAFVVVDPAGAPVVGARVEAWDGERTLAAVVTDGNGAARLLALVGPGRYRVSAPGHWPAVGAWAAGETCRVELTTLPRLVGLVLDAQARPLPAARVSLLAPRNDRRTAPVVLPDGVVPALCDAAGRFDVPWHLAGPCDLVVDAEGHAPFVAAALDPAVCRGGEYRVQLQRAAVVRGRAVAADGSPLASARIEIRARSAAPRNLPAFGPPAEWSDAELLATARSDAAGAFVVDGLPLGAAVATLALEHGAAGRDVLLLAGVTTDVELVAPRPASVRGRATGQGIAAVVLYAGAVPLRTVVPAADGTFGFDVVPPGRCLVAALPAAALADLDAAVAALRGGTAPWPSLAVDLQPGERRDLVLATH